MSMLKLEGSENIKQMFREFPEGGYRKPVIAAFRKAADPVKRAMASNLPGNLKGLKKILKVKAGKGKSLTLAVGFFGNQGVYVNSKGKKWNPYMLVYWSNYGTLANRDKAHNFLKPRSKKSANWKGGITPGGFVERAWEQSKGEAQKNFEETADKEVTKFLNDRALK